MTLRWTRRAALRAAALGAGTTLLPPGAARAQAAFPTRPVRMIVPFAAGGPTDVIARVVAEALGDRWKQPVVVENRAGGGTIVGTLAIARATGDGYTLGICTNPFVINPAVKERMPYDTGADFAAVGMLVTSPFVLVAGNGFGPNTLGELVADARRRGEPLAYASPGPGGAGHLAGALLQQRTGIAMEHVPYNGSAPALTDVLAGRVPVMFDLWSSVRPHVEAGRLKILAVAGDAPLPDAPQVPTIAATLPGFVSVAFQGVIAPAATPPALVEAISSDLRAVTASEGFRRQVVPLGVDPAPGTPAAFGAFLKGEMAKWRDVARAAKIVLD
ncbi:tripartite tricarboxylate transporter substrate binding protein [Roseomonas populi]|uniref:Tripartite tricarboxylate transporter substrate binding protein n=1 Tax=Roseomonas populi TaxID=3121582 RepID=A0ABT1XBD8_9PROT|nr:tripartite tricarboxylate transporter substrate binding protein [Roseomonas pecuniae]MCR0985433.1 tripartite tricarboxylate transporter substrate binding protein [Roseomonas pecuniae]